MNYQRCLALIAVLALLASACATGSDCPDPQTHTAQEQDSVDQVEREEADAEPVDPIVSSREQATRRLAPNDQAAVVWLAEGRNAYIGEMKLAPGAAVPPHRHDSEEYLYIQQGGGVLTIEDREYELSSGAVVAIPVGAEHSYVNGPDTTVAFQVYASSEGAQQFLEWTPSEAPLGTKDTESESDENRE